MCGIAGIINFKGNNVSPKTIEYLLSSQTHRDPSASQTYVNKNIAIGCTRLSMCDTNNKNAVFFNEKKDIILVCNGKIYNYSCIKEYLIKKGHTFLTSNDAEIIPHLYEIYGNNFIQYLDGMFAFCLIDLRASLPKIILGRDVFGIKPLYYYQDSSNFIFSSEIKPILSIIPKQHLDKKAVASYLKYRFIANPLTPFKSIKKVKPSTFIIINDQKLRSHKYFPSTKYVSSFKCLSDILENSVKYHLNSDVKLGSFLSGGLDSSIITGLMTKFMPSILSYTIQYKNFSLDETKFANAMSSLHPEIINNYVNVDEKINLSSTINNIVLALEEPLYSTVTVATYLLAQEAKNNISGVLTGDGSDELFMSYQYLKRSYKNTNPLECYKNNIGWLSERMKNFLFYDKKIFNKIKLINKKYDTINTLRKFELSYRLPDYHLLRIDKLTIAHSIEARVPFLCIIY